MRFAVIAIVGTLLLVGCEVLISIRPSVAIGRFTTDYSYEGRPVVCDDRATTFTYVLRYPSSLSSFDVLLEGSLSGRERYIHTVRLDVQARENGRYERSFSVRGQLAPLSEYSDRAIVVNPRPEIVGHTILVIKTRGLEGRELRSAPIPVLDRCP